MLAEIRSANLKLDPDHFGAPSPMSDGDIMKKTRHDWRRVDAMTDEEVLRLRLPIPTHGLYGRNRWQR